MNLPTIKENLSISSFESVARSLLYLKKVEEVLKGVKKTYKEQVDVFFNERHVEKSVETSVDGVHYSLSRDYGSITKELNVANVIEVLGEEALPFLKVSKTELIKWMNEKMARGHVLKSGEVLGMKHMDSIHKDYVESYRVGSGVKLRKI